MSNTLKDVWINHQGEADLFSLSLESAVVDPDYNRIKVSESCFPETPTEKHPKRHTVCMTYFTYDDLFMLYEKIGQALHKHM